MIEHIICMQVCGAYWIHSAMWKTGIFREERPTAGQLLWSLPKESWMVTGKHESDTHGIKNWQDGPRGSSQHLPWVLPCWCKSCPHGDWQRLLHLAIVGFQNAICKFREAQVHHLAMSILPPCSDQVKSLSQSGFKRETNKLSLSLDELHKELADGPKLPSSEKPVHKADPGWCLGTWTWTELWPFTDKLGSLQLSCLYKPCGLYRQLLLSKASKPQFYARQRFSM